MGIYLDYNASTPIDERVLSAMVDSYRSTIGNSDSRTHTYGDDARDSIEEARSSIAELIGVQKGEVFFTSGATESNNIAVLGLREYAQKSGKKHIITSSIEHKAILESVRHLGNEGFEIEYIDPDESGAVSAQRVASRVRKDTLLVTVMHVNNETGVIQPVKEIGEMLYDQDVLFHIDATQSCGKLVDEIRILKYDMLTISAHKMFGPQGIGALILKKRRYRLPPVRSIMYGGPQEHGIRPGTLPTALIVGFGKACSLAKENYREENQACQLIKDEILRLIKESGVKYELNGDIAKSVSNTINVSFLGVSSEALMISSKQYCGISNGSACTTSSYSHSHVLKSMGLNEDRLESAIRISWGPDTDINAIKTEIYNLLNVVKSLAG